MPALAPISAVQVIDRLKSTQSGHFYAFSDYGRAYNLIPGSVDHSIDSTGIGARSDVTPFMSVELEGMHRLTTHADGAAAPRVADYTVFSRIVLRN
jgi:hypothetical protein